MKHRIYALLLCTCFLLSGCNENTDETETSTEAPPPVETTTGDETPVETTALPSADENLSLAELPFSKIANTFLTFDEPYLKEYFAPIGKWLGSYGVTYLDLPDDGTEGLRVRDAFFTRDSTKKIALSDEEKKNFISEVAAGEYVPFDQAMENSAYSQFRKMNTVVVIENLKTDGDSSNLTADVVNAQCCYWIEDYFSTNAFVAQDENGEIRFIIDPANLIGIPVIAKKPEHLTFELNGIEVMMDSFPVTVLPESVEYCSEAFENRGTDYFYAKIRLGHLNVNYDFETGYDCTASVSSIEPLTDDVKFAMSRAIVMDDPDKDPAMTETYNAIVNNLDMFYKDTTHGITLIDLDFDGTPELLVSDLFEKDIDNQWDNLGVNVSIYRIENGGLKYIDTFPSAHRVVYDISNVLGLKTLPDGTKAWFSTSYDSGNFLYRLEGDQWIATKVLTYENPREVTDESGNTSTEYDYYLMGEKIEPTVIPANEEEQAYGIEQKWEWNGITASFGMWELIGFILADFCSDIEESYVLYNDWLSPYASTNSYDVLDRYFLTEREICYNIAYLVDCFYLGDYNPASHTYFYEFLGAYAKPVIYLYPEEETEVSVQVDFTDGGALTCTYPEYGEGWEVTALPDGTIYDKDGNEYYCLYWEGEGSAKFESGKGWCVAGSDTAAFLREKLLGIGLTAREANEFIIYWLPELQKNPYNIITIHTDDYAKSVPLTVSPMPDTVIRVFMTYEPVDMFTEIEPQTLPHYEREGFTLVEWGGSPAGEAILR